MNQERVLQNLPGENSFQTFLKAKQHKVVLSLLSGDYENLSLP